ncbi:MAG: helicase-related protein, partial [Phycisphaerae bacterium]
IYALPYHAGMDNEDRRRVQDAFMAGRADVIVATIAFGMGIDKPDVRWIIHTAMPSSIEVYHQKIGRAGRDGDPAECMILYHPDDYGMWEQRFHDDEDVSPEYFGRKIEQLDMVDFYCIGILKHQPPYCRHWFLADHFVHAANPKTNCGACDVCQSGRATDGATRIG